MKIYKIQHKDGLFSLGGMRPCFNKTGKVWKKLGHLKLHLLQTDTSRYHDCVILEYEVIEKPVQIHKLSDMVKDLEAGVKIRNQAIQLKQQKELLDLEKKRYEELKKKFEVKK